MRAKRLTVFLAFCVCLAAAVQAGAEIRLPSLFSDHMVLQQGIRLKVWGTANPGERIAVKLGSRKDKTVADENGNWQVKLRSMRAGGPYELTVTGESETLKRSDVLVGEVWVCSGQSNMQWSVSNSNNAQEEIAKARAYRTKVVEIAKADADYLQRLLPEYRKRPKLVIQEIYQDAMEYVLSNTDEKIIIQPTEGAEDTEIRILLNRDPTLKPKSK